MSPALLAAAFLAYGSHGRRSGNLSLWRCNGMRCWKAEVPVAANTSQCVVTAGCATCYSCDQCVHHCSSLAVRTPAGLAALTPAPPLVCTPSPPTEPCACDEIECRAVCEAGIAASTADARARASTLASREAELDSRTEELNVTRRQLLKERAGCSKAMVAAEHSVRAAAADALSGQHAALTAARTDEREAVAATLAALRSEVWRLREELDVSMAARDPLGEVAAAAAAAAGIPASAMVGAGALIASSLAIALAVCLWRLIAARAALKRAVADAVVQRAKCGRCAAAHTSVVAEVWKAEQAEGQRARAAEARADALKQALGVAERRVAQVEAEVVVAEAAAVLQRQAAVKVAVAEAVVKQHELVQAAIANAKVEAAVQHQTALRSAMTATVVAEGTRPAVLKTAVAAAAAAGLPVHEDKNSMGLPDFEDENSSWALDGEDDVEAVATCGARPRTGRDVSALPPVSPSVPGSTREEIFSSLGLTASSALRAPFRFP